jgi:hypothetical protein
MAGRGESADSVPATAAIGAVTDAPTGAGKAERFAFEAGLAESLLAVPLEGPVRVTDWPVAPGQRRTVVLTRHDVYAADAKLVAIDRGKEVEVPRSNLVFLWGSAEGDGSVGVVVWVDPKSLVLGGGTATPDGSYDLRPSGAGTRSYDLSAPDETGGFTCGNDGLHQDLLRRATRSAKDGPSLSLVSSMHSAVIAVDTDNEFMGTKFSDSTANATNYIAQLFAGVAAIYERDLFVRPLQGYTILRLSTTPDPYVSNAGGNADSAKLNEVSSYWNTNYTGVKRALVMMLSGKQPSGGWSGIAWLSGLCNGLYGTSFNQTFRTGITAGTGDFQLVGHEMGHNFGADHTHCTDTNPGATGIQPIDFCNTQCAWTPPAATSCPVAFTINPVNGAPVTNVRGTLMSYCHLLAGCGVTNVFHPQSISLAISGDVDAAVGQCIFPVGNPAPIVTAINPPNGLNTGSTAVTITGTNFRSPATVVFGDLARGVSATGVTVVNPTTITATAPPHAAGVVDVVVMNPDQQTGTLRNGFTYLQGPVVSGITPNSGTTAGGTAVTISGAAFAAPATVTLGGTAATAVNVVNSTTLTATTAAHATGTVDVVVTVPLGPATLPSGYQYFAPPPPGRFYTLTPCRLVDTRNAAGALGGPALVASARRNFTLTGTCGIPAGAKSLSLNITVTGPTQAGFLSLFPGDFGIAPSHSNINFSAGQTRANNTVVLLATNGAGTLAVLNGSAGTVNLIVDVNGYFQ